MSTFAVYSQPVTLLSIFRDYLTARGHKLTATRANIASVMLDASKPMTIEEIADSVQDMFGYRPADQTVRAVSLILRRANLVDHIPPSGGGHYKPVTLSVAKRRLGLTP